MFKLDDPAWKTFPGGYRIPYDASECLRGLEQGQRETDEVWEELWAELHHQGDVDLASYAVVPVLVRICIERNLVNSNVFALVATIEECRVFGKNPPVPGYLENDYHESIKRLAAFGAKHFKLDWEEELARSFLAVAAFATNSLNTGRMLITFSNDEVDEVFEKFFS